MGSESNLATTEIADCGRLGEAHGSDISTTSSDETSSGIARSFARWPTSRGDFARMSRVEGVAMSTLMVTTGKARGVFAVEFTRNAAIGSIPPRPVDPTPVATLVDANRMSGYLYLSLSPSLSLLHPLFLPTSPSRSLFFFSLARSV